MGGPAIVVFVVVGLLASASQAEKQDDLAQARVPEKPPQWKENLKEWKHMEQCLLLCAMHRVGNFGLIQRSYEIMANKQEKTSKYAPWGGKIVPLSWNKNSGIGESLINYLTIDKRFTSYNAEEDGGNALEFLRDLTASEYNAIKFKPVIYTYIPYPLEFDQLGQGGVTNQVSAEIPVPVAIDFYGAKWAGFETESVIRQSTNKTALLESIKIVYQGGTPATAKNDVTVEINFTGAYINDFLDLLRINTDEGGINARVSQKGRPSDYPKNQVYLGSDPENYYFKIIDLLLSPSHVSESQGAGAVFKSQYQPDYGRISLKLIPYVDPSPFMERAVVTGKTREQGRIKAEALQDFFSSTTTTLDLAPIDHKLTRAEDSQDTTLSLTYRGYGEALMNGGLFDALVGPSTIVKRMQREKLLEGAVEKGCSPKTVGQIQNNLMKIQVAENRLSANRIQKYLTGLNKQYFCYIPHADLVTATKGDGSNSTITNPKTINEKMKGPLKLLSPQNQAADRELERQKEQARRQKAGQTEPQITDEEYWTGDVKVKSNYSVNSILSDSESSDQNIYFYYVGDIIDAITTSMWTPIDFQNTSKKLKFGSVEISNVRVRKRQQALHSKGCARILLADMSYYNKATEQEEVINIADIPIAADLFWDWYYDEIIKKEVFRMPIPVFLRRFFKVFVTNILAENCYTLEKGQNIQFEIVHESGNTNFSGIGGTAASHFRSNIKDTLTGKNDPVLREFLSSAHTGLAGLNKAELVQKASADEAFTLKGTSGVLTDDEQKELAKYTSNHDNKSSFNYLRGFNLSATNSPDIFRKGRDHHTVELYKYILIRTIEPVVFNPKNNGSSKTNISNDIHVFEQFETTSDGTDSLGPIKSMSFTKTEDKYKRESRLFNANMTNVTQLSSVYDVNIKTICPMPHIYPGTLSYIKVADLGDPNDADSIAYQLGFGGYHIATKVVHTFSDFKRQRNAEEPLVFESSITAKWLHSGIPSVFRSPDNKPTSLKEATDTYCQTVEIISTRLKNEYEANLRPENFDTDLGSLVGDADDVAVAGELMANLSFNTSAGGGRGLDSSALRNRRRVIQEGIVSDVANQLKDEDLEPNDSGTIMHESGQVYNWYVDPFGTVVLQEAGDVAYDSASGTIQGAMALYPGSDSWEPYTPPAGLEESFEDFEGDNLEDLENTLTSAIVGTSGEDEEVGLTDDESVLTDPFEFPGNCPEGQTLNWNGQRWECVDGSTGNVSSGSGVDGDPANDPLSAYSLGEDYNTDSDEGGFDSEEYALGAQGAEPQADDYFKILEATSTTGNEFFGQDPIQVWSTLIFYRQKNISDKYITDKIPGLESGDSSDAIDLSQYTPLPKEDD